MQVKEIMTKNVITVTAQAKLKEVARIFKEHRINGVPVVNKKNEVIGIITLTDMLKMLKDIHLLNKEENNASETLEMKECLIEEKENATVNMKMSNQVWSVEEDADIDYVLELMCEHNIHTIPVLKNRILVGIIGATDIVDACI